MKSDARLISEFWRNEKEMTFLAISYGPLVRNLKSDVRLTSEFWRSEKGVDFLAISYGPLVRNLKSDIRLTSEFWRGARRGYISSIFLEPSRKKAEIRF